VIFVMVDTLSKYAHVFALTHPYTAYLVAQSIFDGVIKLHGIPRSKASDGDSVFCRLFWEDLFKPK